jgi:hypothetical protein
MSAQIKLHSNKPIRITKITFILIGFLTLNSCWNNESESEIIIEDYFVGWADLVANRSITYSEDKEHSFHEVLVNGYVFAVGNNDKYIIAKQHPNLSDITNTKYFIIDINQKAYKNRGTVFGPMSNVEFDIKTSELNISELKFDKIYPVNPN